MIATSLPRLAARIKKPAGSPQFPGRSVLDRVQLTVSATATARHARRTYVEAPVVGVFSAQSFDTCTHLCAGSSARIGGLAMPRVSPSDPLAREAARASGLAMRGESRVPILGSASPSRVASAAASALEKRARAACGRRSFACLAGSGHDAGRGRASARARAGSRTLRRRG